MNDLVTAPTTAPQPGEAFHVANLSGGEMRMDLSNQWIARPADERFLSLTEMRDHKRDEFHRSRQETIKSSQLEVLAPTDITDPKQLHELSFGLPNGDEAYATNWCFAQACGLAKAPASYLKTIASPIVSDALNYGLRFNREADHVKVYSTKDGDDTLMRAITGPDYGRIPDYEVIDAVMNVAGNGLGDARWKIPGTMDWGTNIYDPNTPVTKDTTTLFASDRDVFAFLVDDRNPISVGTVINPRTGVEEDDLMFRGFYVTNSEVGNSSLKLAAFYLRAICCNRIMWGVEGFEEIRLIHSKGAPDRWLMEAMPALNSFAEGSSKRLQEGVMKAKEAQVARSEEGAMAFLRSRAGLSMKKAQKVLDTVEAEEGHPARSAWDMAQGITAVARNEINTDSRVMMENVSKRILDKVAA